jgi:hypothetical protein
MISDQDLGLFVIDTHFVGAFGAPLILDGVEVQVAQFAFGVHPFGRRKDGRHSRGSWSVAALRLS